METEPRKIFGKGYMTTEELMSQNIPFSMISRWVSDNKIVRIDRGLYSLPGSERDELALISRRYDRGVFSGITALPLLGLSDHVSERFYMTFPKGYNPSSLKDCGWNLSITRVLPKLYDLGLTETRTPCGNVVPVYDRERTLCDLFRGNGTSSYISNEAMKRYFRSGSTDIPRLREYSDILRVRQKIEPYIRMFG